MKKYVLTIVVLYLVSCSTNKQVQLIQEKNVNVEMRFIDYGKIKKMSFYLRKQIKLKNPYTRFVRTKINYFVKGKKVDEIYSYPMDYGKDGNLYIVGSGRGEELYEIRTFPLSERVVILEVKKFIEPFKFEGIHKSLEQYLSLGKHPIRENELTGEKYEDTMVLYYEEPFSEFKRKNPELLEFLTKGDSIELEVISPVKQKYKFKAEW